MDGGNYDIVMQNRTSHHDYDAKNLRDSIRTGIRYNKALERNRWEKRGWLSGETQIDPVEALQRA
jgi:hypothetical protein